MNQAPQAPRNKVQNPAASMGLLAELYGSPIDPGYRRAAARRAGGQRSPADVAVGMLLAVLLGLVVTAAALDLRQPSPGSAAARELLLEQIENQQVRARAAADQTVQVSAQLATLQAQALGSTDPEGVEQWRRDAAASGSTGVAGPGLRVVLSDADPGSGEATASQRVQDIDLQVVVNGLWLAGAEAIAINGHRLTATSAVRSAGSAVLVDMQALTSPYTVEAIGDARSMQSILGGSLAGQHLVTLRSAYGISVRITSADEISMGGVGQMTLRYAATVAGRTSDGSGT